MLGNIRVAVLDASVGGAIAGTQIAQPHRPLHQHSHQSWRAPENWLAVQVLAVALLHLDVVSVIGSRLQYLAGHAWNYRSQRNKADLHRCLPHTCVHHREPHKLVIAKRTRE